MPCWMAECACQVGVAGEEEMVQIMAGELFLLRTCSQQWSQGRRGGGFEEDMDWSSRWSLMAFQPDGLSFEDLAAKVRDGRREVIRDSGVVRLAPVARRRRISKAVAKLCRV